MASRMSPCCSCRAASEPPDQPHDGERLARSGACVPARRWIQSSGGRSRAPRTAAAAQAPSRGSAAAARVRTRSSMSATTSIGTPRVVLRDLAAVLEGEARPQAEHVARLVREHAVDSRAADSPAAQPRDCCRGSAWCATAAARAGRRSRSAVARARSWPSAVSPTTQIESPAPSSRGSEVRSLHRRVADQLRVVGDDSEDCAADARTPRARAPARCRRR